MYRFFYFMVLMLLGLLACKGQQVLKEGDQEPDRVRLLVEDGYSGRETEEHFMITDEKALQKFFAGINKTRKPGLPVPEVDFAQHNVWVYCAGIQTGHHGALQFQKETESSYVFQKVRVSNTRKKQAETSPFYLYLMPKEAKEMVIR